MSMDVFKIHGYGINRLSQRLAEVIPGTPEQESILDEPYDLDEILLASYNSLTENNKKGLLVRMSQGQTPYYDTESEYEAPGLCIYVPQTLIDYEGIPENGCKTVVRDFLKKVLENTQNPLTDKLKEKIPEIMSIPLKEIESEGAFY